MQANGKLINFDILYNFVILITSAIVICGCQKQPPEMFCKKGVLKKRSNCVGVSYKITGVRWAYLETPTQVFPCEIYEIFKSTNFEEYLWTTASGFRRKGFSTSSKSNSYAIRVITCWVKKKPNQYSLRE